MFRAERVIGSVETLAAAGAVGWGLRTDGWLPYAVVVGNILAGRRFALSEQKERILRGYWVGASGLEHLTNVGNRPLIVVSNHYQDGPLRGLWQVIAVNYYVNMMTGREVRWLQAGGGKFMAPVHELAANANGNILLERKKWRWIKELEGILEGGGVIGIHPEGKPTRELQPGVPMAGGLLLRSVQRHQTPVICAAAYMDKDVTGRGRLMVNFGKVIEPEEILAVGPQMKVKQREQKVVDSVMTALALQLPENLRGHYQ